MKIRRESFRVFGAACAAALLLMCGAGTAADPPPPRQYSELDAPDKQHLDSQRALIADALQRRYKLPLTGNEEDIPSLQRLIDDKAFAKTQTRELRALGIAFGDVIAKDHGLHWVMVQTEQGREPTLRYRNTSLEVNAVGMVATRLQHGHLVNLPSMRSALTDRVGNILKTKGLK
jgi:hypothetical protein